MLPTIFQRLALIRTLLALMVAISLSVPNLALAGGKAGKKYFEEGAKLGDLPDAPFDHRPDAVALIDGGPRIGFELLDAQGNAALPRLDLQHHGLHGVADMHQLRGMLHAP